MRIAHLIFVHKEPNLVHRMLEKLQSNNADIYIHVEKKSDIDEFSRCFKIQNVIIIKKRISVKWGTYSMVRAYLSSIEEILNTNQSYSHINILSGQDYPLKNIHYFEQYLNENIGKSFIEARKIPDEWEDAAERFTKYDFGAWRIPLRYSIQKIANKILPNRKIPKGLMPYGKSSWFTITPTCAEYVLNFVKSNPSVCRFFKYTWASDELIFQTILYNSDLKEQLINDNLRYIVFENKLPNPKLLDSNNLNELISSNKFFARKFSEYKDISILEALDEIIK